MVKRIKHLLYKWYVIFKEKKRIIDGVPLKYLFYSAQKSDVLIVGFSACSDTPQYNYVRTLKRFKTNKLFIKDFYTANKRGCFYLNGSGLNVESGVIELIRRMVNKTNSQKLIFIGSSKGGYSALNIGIHFPNANIIIGAPQYLLGNYLKQSEMKSQMDFLYTGDNGFSGCDELNDYLGNNIRLFHNNIKKIYLHYSDMEHTYSEHIVFLLDDLNKCSVSVITDVHHYTSHGDVALYYPAFLQKQIDGFLSVKEGM